MYILYVFNYTINLIYFTRSFKDWRLWPVHFLCIFTGLTNLIQLEVGENEFLSEVKRSTFTPLKHLRILHLCHNPNLKYISHNAFRGLKDKWTLKEVSIIRWPYKTDNIWFRYFIYNIISYTVCNIIHAVEVKKMIALKIMVSSSNLNETAWEAPDLNPSKSVHL